ncbi:DUF1800 family protein [Duganella sp. FT80W]|uniref:DUF1800 family protein n=1 Tax=Duganella guangzhouensis TaxID=2666084 RepID=A0A6I2L4F5_9BURK|nr:DUF1800 domain-containing protein [Duganella guangzhouensis]MRW93018.1 DUF1800 family protein [Duganella guangzhouensis]
MTLRDLPARFWLSLLLLLSACGGDAPDTSNAATAPTALRNQLAAQTVSGSAVASPAMTAAQASRFLMQASFGPTIDSINSTAAMGAPAWIEQQFTLPQSTHLAWLDGRPMPPYTPISVDQFLESFWRQARLGEDQLRQRMAFALSQIMVVSFADGNVYVHPRGVANYYDLLGKYAFGNFRDLLQAVATNPMMGIYLTYLHNQKESGERLPDENFAREVMQLMTIGLYQLNQDGSVKTSNGKPIETYTHDDVAGLAKVFTGWSWAGPDQDVLRFYGTKYDANADVTPMQNYGNYHSSASKSFLGTTLSGGGSAADELKQALDALFNHPNVGPFIGRQLIQRLVTSNPSPAYVSRVAAAFNNNGSGVRGDMKAVIRAILLDSEARSVGSNAKLREPILRLANWLRAFNAKSDSGYFRVQPMEDVLTNLGQTTMRPASVFNFYRPSYTPPNSALASAGMVAPEMQITSEPEVVGYLNFMQYTVQYGFGRYNDIKPDYTTENTLILQPEALVDRINLLLYGGAMSTQLRNQIISAINGVVIEDPRPWNGTVIAKAKRNRVYLAVFLAMAAPEYLVQK